MTTINRTQILAFALTPAAAGLTDILGHLAAKIGDGEWDECGWVNSVLDTISSAEYGSRVDGFGRPLPASLLGQPPIVYSLMERGLFDRADMIGGPEFGAAVNAWLAAVRASVKDREVNQLMAQLKALGHP